MKGYKALDKDMRAVYGNGMQFELGKEYMVTGKIILYKNGFHFCKRIEYLNCCYDIKESRIFEVEAYGDIIIDHQIYVSGNIYLKRELPKEEIKNYFEQNQQLIYSEQDDVRLAVAEQGYGLDVLVRDKSLLVRAAVAKQGYGLDILIRDEDWQVRATVAKQGYGLDVLVHDEDWYVRLAVAEQGYGLNELVHDQNFYVSEAAKEMAVRSKADDTGQ